MKLGSVDFVNHKFPLCTLLLLSLLSNNLISDILNLFYDGDDGDNDDEDEDDGGGCGGGGDD